MILLGADPGPARRRSRPPRDAGARARAAGAPLDGRRRATRSRRCCARGEPLVDDGARRRPAERARPRARRARRRLRRAARPRRGRALALLEDLGRRAALALDNARLYAERDHVAAHAAALAAAAASCRDIPGVELAARYRAAGDGNEVGGDFYDCFATGGGDWALVIGDVCGKGAEAAALTALARYTLRAAALHDAAARRGAGASSTRRCCAERADYRFCTVALRVAHAATRPACAVVLAAGGHPLPLVLRADGEVETVGHARARCSGIVAAPELSEERVELAPGRRARALHRRRDRGRARSTRRSAPERLDALLAACAGRDAAAIAEAVEREALDAQDGAPARRRRRGRRASPGRRGAV